MPCADQHLSATHLAASRPSCNGWESPFGIYPGHETQPLSVNQEHDLAGTGAAAAGNRPSNLPATQLGSFVKRFDPSILSPEAVEALSRYSLDGVDTMLARFA